MSEPGGGWHFDMQTLLLLGGIAASVGAWGYTLIEIKGGSDRMAVQVAELSTRMEKNDSKTNLSEARIAQLEKIAADAILLRRELERSLGEFKADVAVIKEILERIEKERQDGR